MTPIVAGFCLLVTFLFSPALCVIGIASDRVQADRFTLLDGTAIFGLVSALFAIMANANYPEYGPVWIATCAVGLLGAGLFLLVCTVYVFGGLAQYKENEYEQQWRVNLDVLWLVMVGGLLLLKFFQFPNWIQELGWPITLSAMVAFTQFVHADRLLMPLAAVSATTAGVLSLTMGGHAFVGLMLFGVGALYMHRLNVARWQYNKSRRAQWRRHLLV